MSAFIILPGGWAGGWQSLQVARLLKDAGRTVITPALARPVQASEQEAAVNAQVQDVLGLLEDKNLSDVVLVGFALSGEAASKVAERAPERIGHLVFVDARMAENGHQGANGSAPKVASAEVASAEVASAEVAPAEVAPAAALRGHTYVCCTAGSGFAAGTAPSAYRARAAGWAYCEVPADGESRVALPEELAAALLMLG